MRKGFWLRGLVGLFTAVIGAAIGWAGYALISPERAGLKSLPSEVSLLPFDRGFWSFALMLLGAATLLQSLPHPFWTKVKRKAAAAPPPISDAPLIDPPTAHLDVMEEERPAHAFEETVIETPDAHSAITTEDDHEPDLHAAVEAPHTAPF